MAQAGFEGIQVRMLHPVPPAQQLQRVTASSSGDSEAAALVQQLQPNIERLNQMLYGPQDYAAIGYKPADSGAVEE